MCKVMEGSWVGRSGNPEWGSSGNQEGQGVPPVEGLVPTSEEDGVRCGSQWF